MFDERSIYRPDICCHVLNCRFCRHTQKNAYYTQVIIVSKVCISANLSFIKKKASNLFKYSESYKFNISIKIIKYKTNSIYSLYFI